MRKSILIVFLIGFCFINCKKTSLTPDGKPASDAAKNIVRVDVNATAGFKFLICITDLTKPNSAPIVSYTNNNLTTGYEYVFTAAPNEYLLAEVYSQNGNSATCDVYYKGLKVPHAIMGIDSLDGEMPSHINVTYIIGSTTR